jgi:hypothetical protein
MKERPGSTQDAVPSFWEGRVVGGGPSVGTLRFPRPSCDLSVSTTFKRNAAYIDI